MSTALLNGALTGLCILGFSFVACTIVGLIGNPIWRWGCWLWNLWN